MHAEGPLLAKLVAASLLVVVEASAQVPAASAPKASLSWSGPGTESGCLGARGLARAVDDYLERPSFSAGPNERSVTVTVARRESFGWRAVVQVQDAGGEGVGERELVSESEACSSLDEPLTLAVALMVDSELARPNLVPNEPAPKQRKARKPAARAGVAEATPRAGRGLDLRIDGAVVGAFDALPEPTAGVDVGAELVLVRWLAMRVHAVALVPRSLSVEGGAEARFGLFHAGLQACPLTTLARVELGACVGLEAGVVTATTSGFEAGDSTDSVFWGGSAGVRARVRIRPNFSLGASGGMLVPYRRDRFVYQHEGESRQIFRMAGTSWFLGLGAALAL